MSMELIETVGKKLFVGLAILTAGVVIHAMNKDYQIDMESPFFGKWKLSKVQIPEKRNACSGQADHPVRS